MMRSRAFRWLLCATLLGGSLTAAAQPNVRDHRKGPRIDAKVKADLVVDVGPREAPPPPRVEKFGQRRGWVWVAGDWEWKRGKWQWTNGHWEKEHKGKKWRRHRWEKQGDHYVRVDGGWDDAPLYPTAAPPAPQAETVRPKRGHVWVKGRWDWQNGDWAWTPGHWERERAQFSWVDGHWEQKGNQWVWVDGSWQAAAPVALYPTAAPPAPQNETVAPKRGHVWVKGRWDWKNGAWAWTAGHWERERAQFAWQDGRWENQNGKWVWVDGSWVAATPVSAYPTAAPPAPQNETIVAKAGFTWVKGRWDWKAGKWDWVPGHWERERASFKWQDGRWESQNGKWVWVEGSWVASAPAMPPPAPAQPAPPPPGPTTAPPAPRQEPVPAARSGFVWVRGHYGYSQNQYQWIPGHWERARAGTWVDGRWEQRSQGNVSYWVWVEGGWR
jgi:hypothetical protein